MSNELNEQETHVLQLRIGVGQQNWCKNELARNLAIVARYRLGLAAAFFEEDSNSCNQTDSLLADAKALWDASSASAIGMSIELAPLESVGEAARLQGEILSRAAQLATLEIDGAEVLSEWLDELGQLLTDTLDALLAPPLSPLESTQPDQAGAHA